MLMRNKYSNVGIFQHAEGAANKAGRGLIMPATWFRIEPCVIRKMEEIACFTTDI